ncbi:SCP2 sterol-binding domain-containing protein [Alicyclobacillus dauci]|uniref:SCP2 sterol-binding domain-containing protein n=1 Tax=Alicyclobacillus dauci TaxID=1475485 RepID=A0ABY6Z4X8_9BACL|nr:SCP2 sterol-binding domain-containing protein [Alicyclobacillus dauci]WAH37578.1 SCP2 sterol-binding domain-containing protein [Alicyclobacillus dauci]
MSVKQALQDLEKKMSEDNSHIQSLNGVLQFDITGDESETFQVEFDSGTVKLKTDELTNPLCTLVTSGDNLVKLIRGQLNATTAVFTGKLKVKGDLGFAMKIQSILPKYAS